MRKIKEIEYKGKEIDLVFSDSDHEAEVDKTRKFLNIKELLRHEYV